MTLKDKLLTDVLEKECPEPTCHAQCVLYSVILLFIGVLIGLLIGSLI